MKKLMNWLKNEESGQGMVEYGLIIALVAIVLIGALVGLSGGLEEIFGDAQGVLENPESAVS
jgi:pilus assembly protein Flp/PilA